MNPFKSTLKALLTHIRHLLFGHLTYEYVHIEKELESIKLALGKHEARTIKDLHLASIQEAEFRVFSQFGEDGIIQYLINKVPIQNRIFIELGVGNYSESNTRFLLMNNNWQGKIINSGTEHIEFLHSEKRGDFYYRYDITAVSAFIDRNNISALIKDFNVPRDVGILSIDLDGVDYWIWEAITLISPRIVIIEYNSHFGKDFAVTVPYKSDFDRIQEHYSGLYFGSSLHALCILAKKKGYQFVGSNSAGVNAFFVRNDVIGNLPKLTAKQGYVKSSYRDSRDSSGNFTYMNSHGERLMLIANQKIFDVQKGKLTTIGKLFQV
ncbi:MAG: hypothetical protein UX35_C0003G0074 [Microgenomates group bacterium GW2011_GWA1_46_15]|nr:MAG: hypothetical protein UX00_C0004G0064 [Microgenomates group bacterium GW2011_GWB1_45_17]KKU23938.1 MAG: hypothetical protein UX35_C0003G0074 [Microgenomates group bacterium GW2011_GWA1_46_15]KKU24669.1 MAG: hypothetical protein UX36_C0001G0286 [Microgenomates group bacterium GW2011_GWC1_46_15]